MKKIKSTLALLLLSASIANAQTAEKPVVDYNYKPLTLKLDEKGNKYIRFILWNQAWLSSTTNNPGTLDVNGKEQTSTTDIGLRRTRVIMQAQVSPRFMLVTHFGMDNQYTDGGGLLNNNGAVVGTSNAGKKPQMYVHDAYSEYAVIPEKLYIGAGLHYFNGLSRMTSTGTLNMMTLDAPIFNWVNLETTDQFGSQMGIYAKGYVGKLEYRVSVDKPFLNGVLNSNINIKSATQASYVFNESWATQGYFSYNIWDKESNALPYYSGTYLGAKKVLNIGAGWYSHSNATATRVSTIDSSIKTYNQLNLAIDAFLDMPVNKEKGTALSAYSVYYINNYGPNFIRNVGVMNSHSGLQTFAQNAETSWTVGNMQPTLGTGNIWYTQVGFKLPKFNNGQSIMPYITYTNKNFKYLGNASSQFDIGANYFISGHNAKITAQYGTRPVYKASVAGAVPVRNSSKGQFTIQTQVGL